ncbi:MAG TPA: S4 domain-containing protein [Nevskia sp.]|jgi:ribosome-associated heat shock protein Hsp15|nr:S4 domain-containing protein [Nevskia sp.]
MRAEAEARDGVRLDLWLWAIRFYKTRALAKEAVAGGKVKVGGGSAKPSKTLRIGDRLEISRGQDRYEIEVVGLSEQRGPAPVAQRLYRETEASRAAREEAAQMRRLTAAGYAKPATKPDKRARRLIQALGDIDAF